MILSLLQENLLKALSRTSRIITPKAQLPILQNALLSTEGGQLRVTTTNLESMESVWVGAKIDKEGSLCVPARLLTEFVMTLPQDTLRLVAKEGSMVVSSGRTTAAIPSTPGTEFPPVSTQKKTVVATLHKDTLCGALSLVLFAAATDEGRPLLTGVKIRSEEDGVLLAATDGYRLSVKRVALAFKQDLDLVVPARPLSEVVKTALEEKEADSLSFWQNNDGQLSFQIGDTELITRVIDGEYPNFDKIIPKSFTTRTCLEKEALLHAVKSAAIFARDGANIVRFAIDGQRVVISAATPQQGESRVEVGAQVDGDGGEIAFNGRFLLEFLSIFPGTEILFEMTGALAPGVFRPVKDDSFSHIIMPIRTSSS